jgi:hypothetical protein
MNAPTDPLKQDAPLPCPRCGKLFRLPAGFTADHALACPHCQEQVTGQEILNALVPTATIVQPAAVAAGSGAAQPAARPGQGDTRSSRSFDEQEFVIPKPLKTATRPRSSRHPQRRSSRGRSSSPPIRKETNSTTETIKIVFGAIVALPVAQLILWWVFAVDPAGLAAPTSQVLPFVVPAGLRPETVAEEDLLEQQEEVNKDMPPTQQLNDQRIPRQLNPDDSASPPD